MEANILLVNESFRCLKAKDQIILTPGQNNLVLAFSYALAKHTELNPKFVLSEVYESLYIFAKSHMLSCFACYNFQNQDIVLKIIDGVTQKYRLYRNMLYIFSFSLTLSSTSFGSYLMRTILDLPRWPGPLKSVSISLAASSLFKISWNRV